MIRNFSRVLVAFACVGAIGCYTPVGEPGGGTTGGNGTGAGSGTNGGGATGGGNGTTGGGGTGGGTGTGGGPGCPGTCPTIHSSCDPATTTDGRCICDPGYSPCGTACVSLPSDQLNCGYCGNVCDATNGYTCLNATCVCGAGNFGLCPSTDGGPDVCSDWTTDVRNCGYCGHDCGMLQCSNGTCACNSPLYQCVSADGTSYCADISNDIDNCGNCGRNCGSPVQSPDCRAHDWQCVSTTGGPGICACQTGHYQCSDSSGNPNCVDLATDSQNCGSCNHPCSNAEVCVNSLCRSENDAGCSGSTGHRACVSDQDCCPPLVCDQNTNLCKASC